MISPAALSVCAHHAEPADPSMTGPINGQGDDGVGGRVAELVALTLGPERFARFFVPGGVEWAAPLLEVKVRSAFAAKYAESHYAAAVLNAAHRAGVAPAAVRFVVGTERPRGTPAYPDAHAPAEAAPTHLRSDGGNNQREAPVRRVTRSSGRLDRGSTQGTQGTPATHNDPRWSLTNLQIGPRNRLAVEAVNHLTGPRRLVGVGLVFLHGRCGVGKTHLLCGAAQQLLAHDPSAVVRVLSGEQFANAYIMGVRGKRVEPFRQHVRAVDLLAIDDLSGLLGKPATMLELQHAIDAVIASGGRVVVSGPAHPRQMPGMPEGLTSRLLSGLVAEVGVPDQRGAVELVRTLAARRGLRLDDGAADAVLSHAAQHAPGGVGVRDLEGIVLKLDAMARIFGTSTPETRSDTASGQALRQAAALNAAAVERALGPQGVDAARSARPQAARPPVPFERILAAACRAFGVGPAEVRSTARRRPVVLARAMSALLATRLNRSSFPHIGQGLGRKGHSTALSAAKRICKQIAQGETFCAGPDREPESLGTINQRLQAELELG